VTLATCGSTLGASETPLRPPGIARSVIGPDSHWAPQRQHTLSWRAIGPWQERHKRATCRSRMAQRSFRERIAVRRPPAHVRTALTSLRRKNCQSSHRTAHGLNGACARVGSQERGARTLLLIVPLSGAVHGPSARALAAATRHASVLAVASAQRRNPGALRTASSRPAERAGCLRFNPTGRWNALDEGAANDRLSETTSWLPPRRDIVVAPGRQRERT
jgi:hypothetical protein